MGQAVAWLARDNRAFAKKVWFHPAYRCLVAAGVNAASLLNTCRWFRELEVRYRKICDESRGRRAALSDNGRPPEMFSLFQVVCDDHVSGRSDGRRFYAEFTALTQLIFDKTIRPESYHRALMRAYAKFGKSNIPESQNKGPQRMSAIK
ncbi:MAG TPA: hypothetical protein VJ728_03940 [Candidatus Binataceae bacterium]|nr:hypothetical protein [Candidatus Binataceae bacterium]